MSSRSRPRRARLARHPCRTSSARNPVPSGRGRSFVESRRSSPPTRRNTSPMKDSLPVSRYASAVSSQFIPASRAAITARHASSSVGPVPAVSPLPSSKPPRPTAETLRPLRPSARSSMLSRPSSQCQERGPRLPCRTFSWHTPVWVHSRGGEALSRAGFIDHVGIGVPDLEAAKEYYDELMAILGLREWFARAPGGPLNYGPDGAGGSQVFFYQADEPGTYSR